jgi:hypothetical protein
MKMKRKCLFLLPLAGMILFFFPGCNKDEYSQNTKSESANSLVYEDNSLLEEISPYFYDNHIYRIELLGDNQERERILSEALQNGVEEDFLMIEGAQKYLLQSYRGDHVFHPLPSIPSKRLSCTNPADSTR